MICPNCQFDNPDDTRFCGQCGRELGTAASREPVSATMTYPTSARGLERGTTFAGRFEIIEEVGRGGMGTVYKAFDTKIRETVALKLLKPEIASDPGVIERFRNEMRLSRKVAHRHVCRMYDINEEGLLVYISMEFVPGEDLKSFIRRSGHLNEEKAVDLARQIAEGLAEAHRLGVIHRDLKPQNIMIDQDGNAKIMDFGIARSLHARGITATGVIIGTPEYMAPEQAEAKGVDHRSDIYSLGVILYEMVTGRLPFEGETPLSIVLKHRSEPAPDPKEANAQVSEGFSRVILRCLKKRQEDRYQRAEDILADLDGLARGLPAPRQATISRRPATGREITVKFALRKLLIPVLLAAALIVAGIITLNSRRIATEFRRPSRGAALEPAAPPQAPPQAPAVSGRASEAPTQTKAGATAVPDLSNAADIGALIASFGKELQSALEEKNTAQAEQFLNALKGKIPAGSSFAGLLDSIRGRIEEARKLRDAGKVDASRKSYTKGESEMRKLLAEINEKERADRAKADTEEARKNAEAATRKSGPNLLFWIASEKEKDALDSYQKNDFASARILYGILSKVYRLSLQGGTDAQCLAALQGLTKAAQAEAEAVRPESTDAWLYNRAQEDEAAADGLARQNSVPESAERYILAAFLYEKAKDVAADSAAARQR
jgi:hypothetical protein